jgi:hypothetical protein
VACGEEYEGLQQGRLGDCLAPPVGADAGCVERVAGGDCVGSDWDSLAMVPELGGSGVGGRVG